MKNIILLTIITLFLLPDANAQIQNLKTKTVQFAQTSTPANQFNRAVVWYNTVDSVLYIIKQDSTIVSLESSFSGDSIWRKLGTTIFPDNAAWDVGIGNASPDARLHVSGDVRMVENGYSIQLDDSLNTTPGDAAYLKGPQTGTAIPVVAIFDHPGFGNLPAILLSNSPEANDNQIILDSLDILIDANIDVDVLASNNMNFTPGNDYNITATNDVDIRAGAVSGSGDNISLLADQVAAGQIVSRAHLGVVAAANGRYSFAFDTKGDNNLGVGSGFAEIYASDDTLNLNTRTITVSATSTKLDYWDDFTVVGSDTLVQSRNISLDATGIKFNVGTDTVRNGAVVPGPVGKTVEMNNDGDIIPTADSSQSIGNASASWASLHLDITSSATTDPPTDAELDALFGTPATVGAGATFYVKDTDGTSLLYQAIAVGSSWYTFAGSLAP